MDKSPGNKASKRARDDTSGAGGHAVGSGMGRNLSADEKAVRTAEAARQLNSKGEWGWGCRKSILYPSS